VENRDFLEKKIDNGQEPPLPALDILSKYTLNSLRAFSACLGEKTRLLCDSGHELIGIIGIGLTVFLVTVISFCFSNRVRLFFRVNGGESGQKVTSLIHIWLILGCESPIGKIRQLSP
jgi:hypothetical protein